MADKLKEVYFSEYCKYCEHCAVENEGSPCNECLDIPGREYSHKPFYWKGVRGYENYVAPEKKG